MNTQIYPIVPKYFPDELMTLLSRSPLKLNVYENVKVK